MLLLFKNQSIGFIKMLIMQLSVLLLCQLLSENNNFLIFDHNSNLFTNLIYINRKMIGLSINKNAKSSNKQTKKN